MSVTYGTKIGLGTPSLNYQPYNTVLDTNRAQLEAMDSIGNLGCALTENPSTTLRVTIAAGSFINSAGVITSYAGATLTLGASATTNIWLTDAGIIGTGASWPVGSIVQLATVVTGGSTVTSITPARIPWRSATTTTATPTIAAGAGAGTAPTVTITGSDVSGFVTVLTGTSPGATGTVATITFGATRAAAPKAVVLGPGSVNTGGLAIGAPPSGYSTTQWLLTVGAALAASTTYIFTYDVRG